MRKTPFTLVTSKCVYGGQAVANLVTDAHLAALAIEHGCELASTDSDFVRFAKLKWKNPLISSGTSIKRK
jgi:hypothetical protein